MNALRCPYKVRTPPALKVGVLARSKSQYMAYCSTAGLHPVHDARYCSDAQDMWGALFREYVRLPGWQKLPRSLVEEFAFHERCYAIRATTTAQADKEAR